MTNKNRISILPREMRGVMFVSGYRGIGKSFLTLQSDIPDNILFLDFEEKGAGIDIKGGVVGSYHALTSESTDMKTGKPNMLMLFDHTMDVIQGIEQDRYTVAILDNTAPLELAIKAEAVRNVDYYCKQFSLVKANILSGRYGGASAVVNFFVSHLVNMLRSKGIELVIATSHIRPQWGGGGIIPNKYSVKGADRWQELSILTLIMIPGDNPPVPSALVQKEQLGEIALSLDLSDPEVLKLVMSGEIGHDVRRRLPYRLSKATFQTIRYYLSHPANLDAPEPGEMPTYEESDPFDEKLSKEQFAFVKMQMEQAQKEKREEEENLLAIAGANVRIAKRATQELFTSGTVSPPEIVNEILKLTDNGELAITDKSIVTIVNVGNWIAESLKSS